MEEEWQSNIGDDKSNLMSVCHHKMTLSIPSFLTRNQKKMSKSERESLGKTLESLLSTIAKEIEYVEQELESLYNNWFIETSDDWVIPYIADLLYGKHRFCRLVLGDLPLVLSAWIIKYPSIDMRITLLGMLAYLADILRYYQDSIANEAHITTAGKEVKVVLQLPRIRKHNIK